MVAKRDGLCRLQVGEAGHDGICIGFGQIGQGRQQQPLLFNQTIYCGPQMQTDVGGHLVVA